jgi:hypothetical protein
VSARRSEEEFEQLEEDAAAHDEDEETCKESAYFHHKASVWMAIPRSVGGEAWNEAALLRVGLPSTTGP